MSAAADRSARDRGREVNRRRSRAAEGRRVPGRDRSDAAGLATAVQNSAARKTRSANVRKRTPAVSIAREIRFPFRIAFLWRLLCRGSTDAGHRRFLSPQPSVTRSGDDPPAYRTKRVFAGRPNGRRAWRPKAESQGLDQRVETPEPLWLRRDLRSSDRYFTTSGACQAWPLCARRSSEAIGPHVPAE